MFKQMFGKIDLLKIAKDGLHQAEFDLLNAHNQKEYAEAMIIYNQTTITRLKSYIKTHKQENLERIPFTAPPASTAPIRKNNERTLLNMGLD